MEIIVGRKGTQRTPISDLTVSREHCKITIQANGSLILENLSSFGTFINGVSVIKTTVTPEDIIQLGPQFSIKVKDLLPQQTTPSNAPKVAPVPNNGPVAANSPKAEESKSYASEFDRLKYVYEKYSKVYIPKKIHSKEFDKDYFVVAGSYFENIYGALDQVYNNNFYYQFGGTKSRNNRSHFHSHNFDDLIAMVFNTSSKFKIHSNNSSV